MSNGYPIKCNPNNLHPCLVSDREVAIEFFGSLAGSKLMGAKDVMSDHKLQTDCKGQAVCKVCDGVRLQQVMDTLKK